MAGAPGCSPPADERSEPGERPGRLQRRVAVLDGEPGELRVVAQPELLQDMAAVGVDRLDADLEVLRDLTVGHAARQHLHDLLLAGRERAGGVAVTRPE